MVCENNDITLQTRILADHATFRNIQTVSLSTLDCILHRNDMRMKRVYRVQFERNTERKELRREFVLRIQENDTANELYEYIFIDEAGFNLVKRRRRGRNFIGQWAIVEVPGQRGGKITIKMKSWWIRRKFRQIAESNEELGDAARVQGQGQGTTPWETDYQLLQCEGLFDEYLDMVLQFGFVTIFVAAIPIAPLFALINNWLELRMDAQKFVCEYRRPVAKRAEDIGIWLNILEFVTLTAVISNAFLIAFTSDFLPRLYYRYTTERSLKGYFNFTLSVAQDSFVQNHTLCRYRGQRDHNGNLLPEYFHLLAIQLAFVIIFEHVVIFIGKLINGLVPDVPEDVAIKVKTEQHMAKEVLAERSPAKKLLQEEEEKEGAELRRRCKPETSTS